MKIGILSDTHNKVKLAKITIDFLLSEGAEFLIHAGDIVEVEILELLQKSGLRYVAVYGNNDAHLVPYHNKYNLVQEPHYFKLANTRFKLMHLPFYMSPDADVIIFGHTHTFEVEFQNKTLYLNPGEVCARNKDFSECAMLNVEPTTFTLSYYTRKKEKKYKEKKKITYTRQNHE
jgi:putative phosphoesterase